MREHTCRTPRSLITALALVALGILGAPAPRARAQAGTIGINVLLNEAPSARVLADLADHGAILDVLPGIQAVLLRAEATELPVIQALPYVAAANPDRERQLAGRGGSLPVADFAGGTNVWNLDAIDVTDAGVGRTVPFTGEGVYVAVFDSGLVYNWREYLPEERIATQFARAFGGGGGEKGTVSEKPQGWEQDTVGHGTMVTSIVLGFHYAGPEDLPASFNGVAPKATVIPIAVLDGSSTFGGQRFSSVLNRALEYLTELKRSGALGTAPLVVNMSLGGPDPDTVERAAIDRAIAHGIVVVACAGNSGEEGMWYPGAYAPVISAGATAWAEQWPADDPTGLQWMLRDVVEEDEESHLVPVFSSRELAGQDLDVCAPGAAVPAAMTQDGRVDYVFAGGTSAAAPHVTGVAALMLEKNASLVQGDVEEILELSAMPIGPGCRDVRIGVGTLPGRIQPSWSNAFDLLHLDITDCWGADASGNGLLQADAALAATPLP